ncbi:ANTAR domain-containing response regulator [Chitinolyticbacter meiyuanensis]|uniref:ANTAR domain-containing response regulator n=1 Tax=Chitinolyticbacter meiyuanensis TaxID=682798 RepID=UPI001FE51948|nr:ANTAR domain-containing protein [Chitinolyticbacter meiyuanensis]
MSTMLRILLVTDTAKPIGQLAAALTAAGFDVIAQAPGARALAQLVESRRPDVVIVDTESPSRDTLEQLAVMNAAAPRPVVMFSDCADPATVRAAVAVGVTAYVVEGVAPARLAAVIAVAQARFDEDNRLREKLADAEQKLAERKLIDKAKGLLMDKRGLTEAEAFETLRRQAMNRGMKLADVARQLIAMADLLG